MTERIDNKEKRVPKGNIKFDLVLSEEQKAAKEAILKHPVNFIFGLVKIVFDICFLCPLKICYFLPILFQSLQL
jgi:hypothetical protein